MGSAQENVEVDQLRRGRGGWCSNLHVRAWAGRDFIIVSSRQNSRLASQRVQRESSLRGCWLSWGMIFLFVSTLMPLVLEACSKGKDLGRVRHLDAKLLWVQSFLTQKIFSLHAVPGKENVADIGTKALDPNSLSVFLA